MTSDKSEFIKTPSKSDMILLRQHFIEVFKEEINGSTIPF